MMKMVKVSKLVNDVKAIRPDAETKKIISWAKTTPDQVIENLTLDDEVSEYIYDSVIRNFRDHDDEMGWNEVCEKLGQMDIFGDIDFDKFSLA